MYKMLFDCYELSTADNGMHIYYLFQCWWVDTTTTSDNFFFFSSVTHYFCDLRGLYYVLGCFRFSPLSSKPFGRYYIYFFNVYFFWVRNYCTTLDNSQFATFLAAIKLYQNIQSNQLVEQNRTEQQSISLFLYNDLFFFTISIDFCLTNFILKGE